MLVVLFREINLLLTIHTINSDYGKLPTTRISYILYTLDITNVCCLLIELYPKFNVRLGLCEYNIYLSTLCIHNTVIVSLMIFMLGFLLLNNLVHSNKRQMRGNMKCSILCCSLCCIFTGFTMV